MGPKVLVGAKDSPVPPRREAEPPGRRTQGGAGLALCPPGLPLRAERAPLTWNQVLGGSLEARAS